jgi:hypothetical protein
MFEALQPPMAYRVLSMRWADGLQLPGGFTKASEAKCCVFLRYAIARLLDGGALKPDTPALVWEAIYGPGWRAGNEDGSRYVVLQAPQFLYPSREFSEAIAQRNELKIAEEKRADQLWFFQLDAEGSTAKMSSQSFLERLAECQFPQAA